MSKTYEKMSKVLIKFASLHVAVAVDMIRSGEDPRQTLGSLHLNAFQMGVEFGLRDPKIARKFIDYFKSDAGLDNDFDEDDETFFKELREAV